MLKLLGMLIALLTLVGCAARGPMFVPASLAETPITDLVAITPPDRGRLVQIDGTEVRGTRSSPYYVAPGEHALTFSVRYVSKTYCSGPLTGSPATADYVQPTGQEASRTGILIGNYNITVSAESGEAISFSYKPEPDCKRNLEDYYTVAVANQE